jgi:Tol biopolymer transport system component
MRNSKIYVSSPGDPVPQEVSDQRGRPDDWTRDGRYILLSPYEPVGASANTRRIRLIDVAKHQTIVIAEHPEWLLHPGRFSPDNRWLSFYATNSTATRQIHVASFQTSGQIPPEKWIAVTDGKSLDREPRWSPDGNTIYFLSERDGFRCIWAQRLDSETKRPRGDPFAVFHAHSARFSLDVGTDTNMNGLTVTNGRIYVTIAESTGNLWFGSWQ